MRVVVTGATGNVGTSVLQALVADDSVEEIVGLARRAPGISLPKTSWVCADVASSPLEPVFRGADAVVHLAWLIQPARDRALVRAANVEGSRRVFEAVAGAGVPALVHASSVGAYSPRSKLHRVDESWPTAGIPTSFYSRHKAEVERLLDHFERDQPGVRVVRMRPGLIFKREAASGIRRLFAGPLLPGSLLRRGLIPALPLPGRLAFQAVHSLDVGEAYRLAVVGEARGAFNIAADPVLDPAELAGVFGARHIPVRAGVLRAAAAGAYHLHLQPTEPGWLDLALNSPLLDTNRAHTELGWMPVRSAREALTDLLAGLREGAGLATPPLSPNAGGPLRIREVLTGVGSR
jgi:nucleoside-diphosphate-sugar epimerase